MIRLHSGYNGGMKTHRTTIYFDKQTRGRIDRLVKRGMLSNRSRTIRASIEEKLGRIERLSRQCAKLDPAEEQHLAEEGMSTESEFGA